MWSIQSIDHLLCRCAYTVSGQYYLYWPHTALSVYRVCYFLVPHTHVLGQKKKIVMLPSPDQNLKIGSVGQDFFFFFFFTYRERIEFSNIFFKVSKWGKLGRNAVKTHYKSCKCFFKPLNTNFSKFFAQIWHKKKKNPTLFFRILRSVGRGQHNIFFFLALCMGSGSATGFFYAVRLVHSLLKYFFKFQLWYWIQIYTTKYSNLLLIILILVWIVCSTYRKGEILMQKWHVTSQFVYCYMPY